MTDRERLIELLDKTFDEQFGQRMILTAEHTADYLLKNGVIVPPCKVGDTVYMVIADDFDLYISEEKVTEVGSKGFHISDFFPPKDDIGDFISYEKIGKTVFLTYEEADKAIDERSSNNATQQPYTE